MTDSHLPGLGEAGGVTLADRFERVLFTGPAKPLPELFQPVINREHPWTKPKSGGLWTAPPHPTNGSHWIDWCVAESFGSSPFRLWELIPRKVVKVFVVDTYADLELLHDRYGIGSKRDYGSGFDFEAIGREWDALHLTDEGQWATRLSHPLSLYGWDCESTLWFRWMFTQVNDLGEFTPPEGDDD